MTKLPNLRGHIRNCGSEEFCLQVPVENQLPDEFGAQVSQMASRML